MIMSRRTVSFKQNARTFVKTCVFFKWVTHEKQYRATAAEHELVIND